MFRARIGIGLLALICLTLGVAAKLGFSQSSGSTASRLGLKGQIGYLVTQIDPSVNQPEVRIGDIIVGTSVTGQISSVEEFQAALRAPKLQTIPAKLLRFDPLAGGFQDVVVTLKTFPFGQYSRSGLIGTPGYFIKEIDPTVTQPGVRVGDFITATSVTGQIIDMNPFQAGIKQLPIGSTIQGRILRWNTSVVRFDDLSATLTTYPFPASNLHHRISRGAPDCPAGGQCQWCCSYCNGGQCARSQCETGKTACTTGGSYGCFPCCFAYCV